MSGKQSDGKRDEKDMGPAVPEREDEAQEAVSPETGAAAEADLETQLVAAQAEASEYLEGWQRARAELANYRKRTERERAQWQTELRAELISSLLPVLDDFDLAMQNMPAGITDDDWAAGVALIYRKFQTQLKEQGVEEIPAEGESFDPHLHEAVMRRNEPDAESGTIVEVLRKGYRLGDKIIRPSLVVVAE